jgi:DNA-directed RNA polymerase subunit E'/Rpb7
MSVYKKSLLNRNVLIPMNQMGGNVTDLLRESLKVMEGTCVEEGYVQRGSINIFNYSCGVLKGPSVHTQVTFECYIANPFPGETFDCVVEHNTKAGIKARLNEKESPFIVFLARDHHNKIPEFSEIKEHDIIQVSVLGQRFEINDPKISIIATLIEVKKEPEIPETVNEIKKEPKKEMDQFVFYYRSADKPPGNGKGEVGKSQEYAELGKIPDWRKQLSHFDVAKFQCDGSPENNINFPAGSSWNTLEHFWQASKLSLANQEFANTLCVGGKNGNSDGAQAQRLRKGIIMTQEQLTEWERIKMDVMYTGALAKFSQHPEKLNILCLTKKAMLMHFSRGEELEKFTHYEKVRDELCTKET